MIDITTTRTLPLRRWNDVQAREGVDPRSRYVDHYWIPTLGPTSVCLARALMRMIARSGDLIEVHVDHLVAVLGLGPDGAGAVTRSLQELFAVDVLTMGPEGEVLVRSQFPYLTAAQVADLPGALATAHRAPSSLRAAACLDAPTGRAQALGPHARILSLAATVDEILVNPSLDAAQLAFRWQHVVRLAEEARDDVVLEWAPSDLEATLAEGHLAGEALNEALWDAQRAVASRRTIGADVRDALAEGAAGIIDWLVSEFPTDSALTEDA